MLMIRSAGRSSARQQVKELLKSMVDGQVVSEGRELPAPETLAVRLVINPNTVRTAYEELEQEGYVFCSEEGDWLAGGKEEQSRIRGRLLHELDCLVEELVLLGVTVPQLTARIGEVKEHDD